MIGGVRWGHGAGRSLLLEQVPIRCSSVCVLNCVTRIFRRVLRAEIRKREKKKIFTAKKLLCTVVLQTSDLVLVSSSIFTVSKYLHSSKELEF